MFNNVLFGNRNFYEIMSKTVVKTEKLRMTSQYGPHALHAGKGKLQSRTLMHRARLHTRTHRPISNIYCSSTATMIHEPAPLLRYTYIAFLVSKLPMQERRQNISFYVLE